MMMRSLVLISMLLVTAASVGAESSQPIVIFAGSASQPPLEEAAEAFKEMTGVPVTLHIGGSGAMLSQIRLTGQGDLYIPGSPDYMDKARAFGLIQGEPAIIAYLVPALIVAEGNPLGITGLQDLDRKNLRIGLADPDSVCVGLYAVEIIEANTMTSRVRHNLRGMVESCAKAAAMIPLKLVDVVLGWREFSTWRPEAMDTVLLAPHEIPRLAYIPSGILQQAENPRGAEAFIAFLKSEAGKAIFQKWGYMTDESAAREFAPLAKIGGTYTLPEGW